MAHHGVKHDYHIINPSPWPLMGPRSQRYAAVIKDGVIDKLFVEAKGEFRVSSAEYVLEQL